MKTKIRRSVATLINETKSTALNQVQQLPAKTIGVLWALTLFIQPGAAQTDSVPEDCTVPDGVDPIVNFLNSVTELAFLAGVSLATLTFVVAGIYLILPGQDNTRKGKKIAKNGLLGALLLLSAEMVTSYIVGQFPGVC